MTLPKVMTPEFPLTLPITKKVIKYRPFLAKEEKILLMAMETDPENAEETIKNSIKQILENCVLTKNVEIETLPEVDLEWLFLHVRMKSVGETVELEYDARDLFECAEEKCIEKVKSIVDLKSVSVSGIREDTKIMLNSEVGVVLKYAPVSFDTSEKTTITEKVFNSIAAMIEKIFTLDDVIVVDKLTKEERDNLPEWIENSFDSVAFQKVMDFLENPPYLNTKVVIECPLCKKKKEMEVRGISDFFI